MRRRTFVAILAVVALAVGGAGLRAATAAESDYSRAQFLLFDTPHLQNVAAPVALRYDFRRRGTLGEAFDDRIEVIVTEVLPDGRKNLRFEFLSGERQRRFPDVEGFRGNPLIMLFLQRDADIMAVDASGSERYFRNRIRNAFREGAEVDEVTVPFDGRDVAVTRVTIRPYVGDPNRDRFARFENKVYEFLLSSEVPGGIYQIRSVVPSPAGGEPLREEAVTYRDEGA